MLVHDFDLWQVVAKSGLKIVLINGTKIDAEANEPTGDRHPAVQLRCREEKHFTRGQ